jgi:hypothetical protein
MNINKHPNLEDLLKVKKAEQPDDVFWEKFDRDLQEKTLQISVSKKVKNFYKGDKKWHYLGIVFIQ